MINRRRTLASGAAIGATAVVWNARAVAAVFMDIADARRVLVPAAASFQLAALRIDAQVQAAVAQASTVRVPGNWRPAAWIGLDAQGRRAGFVAADQVIGKYELIDFAAGFAADGTLLQMEVLAYRESHGAEIRNLAWRKQFAGRKGPSQMRFGEDIRNISGATLSCQHVTEGVQRLAALVQAQLVQA